MGTPKQSTTTLTSGNTIQSRRLRLPSLSLAVSERKLLLAVVDLVAINAALFATLLLRRDFQPDLVPSEQSINWFVILSVLWLAVALFVDVYALARAASAWHSFWASAAAVFLTDIIYLLIPYVTPALTVTRLSILAFIALTILGVGAWRIFYASVFVQPGFHQRALVVGAGLAGRTLAQ